MALALSAVLVAGPCRARAQRVVEALLTQTRLDAIEIIVVDLADASVPPLTVPSSVAQQYLSRPTLDRWGEARAEAVRAAKAPVVAFIEDHCFPAPTWAEWILDAHQGPWAAVGYAFTNANPRSRVSRAAMLARYGMFAHPARRGEARYISGNNVSYRRDLLLSLDDRLATLLDIDFNLQEALLDLGHALFVESRALAAHTNYDSLGGECRTGRPYCRLLAAHRASEGGWGLPRRLLYGVLTPVSAPILRLWRLSLSLRGRQAHWRPFLAGLPLIVMMYVSDALGESAGYLLGPGTASRAVLTYELQTEREV